MKYIRRRFKPHDGILISTMPHTMHVYDNEPLYDLIRESHWKINNEVVDWCNETFGEMLKSWAYYTGSKKKIIFYFTCKDHAMAFKLRWA